MGVLLRVVTQLRYAEVSIPAPRYTTCRGESTAAHWDSATAQSDFNVDSPNDHLGVSKLVALSVKVVLVKLTLFGRGDDCLGTPIKQVYVELRDSRISDVDCDGFALSHSNLLWSS